jgi:hypothetical protein
VGSALERVVSLASLVTPTVLAGVSPPSAGTTAPAAPTPIGLPMQSALSIKPGSVVSHPTLTHGKRVKVSKVSNRSNHVEIIGAHVANGRGIIVKSPPAEQFNVHPSDIPSESTVTKVPTTGTSKAATTGAAKLNLPKGQQITAISPGYSYQ